MSALSTRSLHRSSAAILLLAAVLVLAFVQPALAEASFTFRVRGYGHGLGMSQYGAKGFAEAGYHYTAILRYYYGSAGTDPKTQVQVWREAEPSRHVKIDAAANSTNAGYTRATWTIRPGNPGAQLVIRQAGQTDIVTADTWSTFTAAGNTIVWTGADARTKTYTGTVTVFEQGGPTPRLVQVKERTGGVSHQVSAGVYVTGWDYTRYRGEMRLAASAGAIKLINRVAMNEYLYGVVPRESPASWHREALKAQAVAARAYSWVPTLTNPNAELWTTTSDQVYGGHSRGENRALPEPHEDSRTNAAVDVTKGVVVTYAGEMARTYFFSTSGGHTENSENVWVDTLPYIRGVPDPFEVVSGAARHSWREETWPASDVSFKLRSAGLSASLVPTDLVDVNVVARGVSGRPTRIELVSLGGVKTYIEGSTNLDRFKRAFAWGDRWFVVNPKTYRIAGTDRYHTSVQASLQAFAPSSPTPAKVAVVVGGFAEPDALAAAGMAGAAGGGPVLLTPSATLDSRVRAEIDRLNVSTVYIVGGIGAVSSEVMASLKAIPGVTTVTRLGGAERYETAALVAAEIKRLKGQPSRVVVVSGESIVDGVVASSLAYAKALPVVLVRAGSVPATSRSALTGVTTSLVVGASGVISDDVVTRQLPGGTRIAAGLTRYHTAALLGDYLVGNEGFTWSRCYVASGMTLADALAIGPTSGKSGHPVLLAEDYSLAAATKDRLLTKKAALGAVWIVGGEGVLSGWLQTQVEATLE